MRSRFLRYLPPAFVEDPPTTNSTSAPKNDLEGSGLCPNCSKVNIDDAFSNPITDYYIQNIFYDDACHLCNLFREVANGHPDLTVSLHWFEGRTSQGWGLEWRKDQYILLTVKKPQQRIHMEPKFLIRTIPDKGRGPSAGGPKALGGIDWDILRHWLRSCSSHHQLCPRIGTKKTSGLSLRVIDCTTRKLVTLPSFGDKYATLSYVWGGSGGPDDDGGGDDNNDNDGDTLPEALPPLITDSLEAVRHLGLRYLWIDRYCIHQNNHQEKHTLIQNMGYIYANSYVTLIASSSDNPSQGLPGVSIKHRDHPQDICCGKYTWTSLGKGVSVEVKTSIWNSRGWTYQEALLAPRRLVFTTRQVYFQCQEAYCFEALGTTFLSGPEHDQPPGFKPVFPLQRVGLSKGEIQNRIYEYAVRHLTYDTDILNAISGVLKTFSDIFGIASLCGIPIPLRPTSTGSTSLACATWTRWMGPNVNSLVVGLGWRFRFFTMDDPQFVRRHGFPSWSWVGWKFQPVPKMFLVPGFPSEVGTPNNSNDWVPLDGCLYYCLSPCAQVSIEFDDGVRLPWDTNKNEILARGNTGNLARTLHIRSWVGRFAESGGVIRSSIDDVQRHNLGCMGLMDTPWNVDSVTTSRQFAHAINNNNSNLDIWPEVLAVVMSASESGIVAMLVTPRHGTDHYEFCGIHRFRNRPSSSSSSPVSASTESPRYSSRRYGDVSSADDRKEWSDPPSPSPFPKVDDLVPIETDGKHTFIYQELEYELRTIIVG